MVISYKEKKTETKTEILNIYVASNTLCEKKVNDMRGEVE